MRVQNVDLLAFHKLRNFLAGRKDLSATHDIERVIGNTWKLGEPLRSRAAAEFDEQQLDASSGQTGSDIPEIIARDRTVAQMADSHYLDGIRFTSKK